MNNGSLMATAWTCRISLFKMNNAAMTRPAVKRGSHPPGQDAKQTRVQAEQEGIDQRAQRATGQCRTYPENARTDEKAGGK